MELDQATLQLLDVVLEDGGLQGLADKAAKIVGRPVWLMDVNQRFLTDPNRVYPVLQPLCSAYSEYGAMDKDNVLYVHQAGHIESLRNEETYLHYNALLETNVLGIAVRISGVVVAYLFAGELGRAFSDTEIAFFKKLRELCALELRHSHGAKIMNESPRSRLLYELLDHQCRTVDHVLNLSQALGIQFQSRMRLVIIYQESGWQEGVPWLALGESFGQVFKQCFSAVYQERLVLLVNQKEDFSKYQWLRLSELLEGCGLKAATSRPFSKLEQTFTVYLDTLELIRCMESSEFNGICHRYEDCVLYLAAHYLKGKIPVNCLADGALEKLRAYDAQYGQLSFETMQQLARCSFDMPKTAEAMNVHRNTMRYRVKRLEDITGIDLNNGKNKFELMLAFTMDELNG